MTKYIYLLLFTFLFSCSSNKKMTSNNTAYTKAKSSAFDKQGHRGCRGLMPENTIPAMIKALDLGVTTLEMDICFSADKKVLLSHEPFFNHEITTKPDGSFIEEKNEKNYNLYLMKYDSIIKYDVGLKPHPRFTQQQKIKAIKPLLADVFAAIKQEMITRKRPLPYFNIETKTMPATDNIYHPAPAAFVNLLMQVIKDNNMEDYVIIQSFDIRTLQYLHKQYSNIKTALLYDENENISIYQKRIDLNFMPTIISPHYSHVTSDFVERSHIHHVKVIPWTVNDKAKIIELKKMGVDGIITDYPNLFEE